MTETLFDVVAVTCFFGCGEIIRDPDPQEAHARMERHYSDEHGPAIAAIVEFLT